MREYLMTWSTYWVVCCSLILAKTLSLLINLCNIAVFTFLRQVPDMLFALLLLLGKLCIYILHCLLSNCRSLGNHLFFCSCMMVLIWAMVSDIVVVFVYYLTDIFHATIVYFNSVTIKDFVQSICGSKMFLL